MQWVNEKNSTQKEVGEGETQLHRKPTPCTAIHNSEGTHNCQLLLEEQKVWIPHLGPQPLRLSPEGRAPRHLALKVNGDCKHESHKALGN